MDSFDLGGEGKLVFYDSSMQVLEEILVFHWTRAELNEIIVERGFRKITGEL